MSGDGIDKVSKFVFPYNNDEINLKILDYWVLANQDALKRCKNWFESQDSNLVIPNMSVLISTLAAHGIEEILELVENEEKPGDNS